MLGGKSGQTGNYINDLYWLNPNNLQTNWQIVAVDNTLPQRNGHTCTAVGGSLYVFGGWNQTTYFNDLWIFDVSALYLQGEVIWMQSAALGPASRDGHSAVEYGGELILFGGFWHDVTYGPEVSCATEPCIWFNDLWAYSTIGSKWTQLYPGPPGVLPSPRYGHVAEVVGENMYVFGGYGPQLTALNDMWAYSFAFNIWQQLKPTGSIPSPRYNSASWVVGEAIYVFGGNAGADLDLYAFYPHENPDTTSTGGSSSSTNVEGLEAAVSLNVILTFVLAVLGYLIYREVSTGGGTSSASTTTTVYS
jgi:N-acetylneuraminic acid mutarotase